MERISRIIKLGTMLAIIVFFVSCQKLLDHWPKGHGNKVDCKIKKVIYPEFEYNYYYGSKGLLDSIIRVPEDSYIPRGNSFFKYDQQNRLIEYAEYYDRDPEHYIAIHHYKYSGNRIVQDTGFIRIAAAYTEVLDIEYDFLGRITKTSGITWVDEDPSNITPSYSMRYGYDDNGNRNKIWFNDDLSTYDNFDDKVDYIRTDPVLQFIYRDYNKNNSLPGPTSYNDKGLPITFAGVADDPYSFTAIEYNCE